MNTINPTILIGCFLSVITFLLGIITYFLKKHLQKFDDLETQVGKHEIRLGKIDTEIINIKNNKK